MFDIPGVLILVVLVALFGFLGARAWRLKNTWLKHYANRVAEVTIAGSAAQIARGQRLAHICASCHSPDRQLPLSDVNFVTKFRFPPVGTFYAPNLTPSGNIQDWTDGEVIRAIREGVHKDGRSLLVMPSESFRNMSDDVRAVVAYLRSLPATGGPTPENQWNVLGAVFINLTDFRTAQQPAGSVTAPQPGTPEYGKYMVDVIGCRGCHRAQLQGKVDNGQPGPPPGPNLTQIVPSWTEEQFMTFFNAGKRPDGSPVPTLTLPDGTTGLKDALAGGAGCRQRRRTESHLCLSAQPAAG